MSELLTTRDVARIADRSSEWIRAAANGGRIKVESRTPNGQRLFTREEAERFAASLAKRPREATQGA